MIDQLDAANLDDAVAIARLKAGGFSIENNFPHSISASP
jgi:hypothetical protein